MKRENFNWEMRYKIIRGIAQGIQYLHEDSPLQIIHRYLKAGNISLDANMNPKIADFGMARMFVSDETEGSTNRIVGTYKYMALEYAMFGQFSIKSDVFSFSVLILEIVSSQKITSFRNGENVKYLLNYAADTFFLLAGPNVIESEEHIFRMAKHIKTIAAKIQGSTKFNGWCRVDEKGELNWEVLGCRWFSSQALTIDKANRTSSKSFRGPGMVEGLKILEKVKLVYDIPIVTDVHETIQFEAVGRVADIIQIPAFLCHQTDLLMFFSKSTPHDMQDVIKQTLGVSVIHQYESYLGLLSFIGRSKKDSFAKIKQQVWKRLQGWEGKLLSQMGREVLIKAVAQALPTYTISCFKLLRTLCHEIEARIRKVFKLKFFPDCSIMQAKVPSTASYTWKSIIHGREVIRKGVQWRIGDGHSVRIWGDRWIPKKNNPRIISPILHGQADARALYSCPKLEDMWREKLNWTHSSLRQANCFTDLLGMILVEKDEPELFGWVVWDLWNRKNNLRLGKSTYTSSQLLEKAVERKLEVTAPHQTHNAAVAARVGSWTAPDPSWYKIYFDGVVFVKEDKAELGAVIRNSEARRALELAVEIGIDRVILESDSVVLMQNLKNAHSLARWAPLSSPLSVWMEDIPPDVEPVYMADLLSLAD
uniref:non-specific serine/threonine protein kinase n=1 Tax=Quercus lobata TaxID=97700 RepID=A0A7N2LLF5_QUELO